MTTHHVVARRYTQGWELHIDGIGVTQAPSLAESDQMARDYLATDLGGSPDDYEVTITVEPDEQTTKGQS